MTSAARQCRHSAGRHLHTLDLVVATVAHEQRLAVAAQRQAIWGVELGSRAHTVDVTIIAARQCRRGLGFRV